MMATLELYEPSPAARVNSSQRGVWQQVTVQVPRTAGKTCAANVNICFLSLKALWGVVEPASSNRSCSHGGHKQPPAGSCLFRSAPWTQLYVCDAKWGKSTAVGFFFFFSNKTIQNKINWDFWRWNFMKMLSNVWSSVNYDYFIFHRPMFRFHIVYSYGCKTQCTCESNKSLKMIFICIKFSLF